MELSFWEGAQTWLFFGKPHSLSFSFTFAPVCPSIALKSLVLHLSLHSSEHVQDPRLICEKG